MFTDCSTGTNTVVKSCTIPQFLFTDAALEDDWRMLNRSTDKGGDENKENAAKEEGDEEGPPLTTSHTGATLRHLKSLSLSTCLSSVIKYSRTKNSDEGHAVSEGSG